MLRSRGGKYSCKAYGKIRADVRIEFIGGWRRDQVTRGSDEED